MFWAMRGARFLIISSIVGARGGFFLGEAAFASGLGQGVFKQDHGGFPLIGAWAAGFDPAACLRLSRDAP